jgi:membrane-associated phospholipid phosphatase
MSVVSCPSRLFGVAMYRLLAPAQAAACVLMALLVAFAVPVSADDSRQGEHSSGVADEARAWGRAAGEVDWTSAVLLGTGITLASSALDVRAFRIAERHKDSTALRDAVRLGNALPVAAVGLSAALIFDSSQPRLADTGLAAFEAGVGAAVLTEGLKVGFGRARPETGLGKAEFDPLNTHDDHGSFPSRHVTVMWAAVTPYALEYDMPWLYAAAAVTNLARVASREHGVSDTVGGAFIGYGLGRLAWQARKEGQRDKRAARLIVGPQSLAIVWTIE